jgi:hypothetical protein
MRRTIRKRFQLRDRYVYLLLVAVSILARIPFLKTFDLVTYDGTYYVNHAMTILGVIDRPSAFPFGYPIFIALFIRIIHDGVRAAQTVSLLAGLGSLLVFYLLAKRFVQRSHALLGAFILALTPLFINLSMVTMSESIYILWVLLGFFYFSKGGDLLSGLFLGMASITRPEALGILGILAVLRFRRPKKLVRVIVGFACVYCVNVAVQSGAAGKLVLVPKANLFGTSASYWQLRETWISFQGKERVLEQISKEGGERSVFVDYLKRLPREVWLLVRHVSPVIFLLSLYGMRRRRLFLLAVFVPFLVFPLFTFRSEPRFILPHIPVLILYSLIGMEGLRRSKAYRPLYSLFILSAAAALFVNKDQLTVPVSNGMQWTKGAKSILRGEVRPWDKIADRKPFFAFYAESRYVEIPVAPYDDTIENLAAQGVKYLVLHQEMIQKLRPRLNPLLYDRAVINGEMRFSQFGFSPDGVCIYRRNMESEPVQRRSLIAPIKGRILGLSWSPDGRKIAYHLIDASGVGGIYVVSPDGNQSHRIVTDPATEGQLTWAPDSRHIAFAMKQAGNMNIYICDEAGRLKQITSHCGTDASPSWSKDGKEIVFCSDMSGQWEIWLKNLETGALKQITASGGNLCPAISPDGKRIAWIREREGLSICERNTGVITRADSPRNVSSSPAWSPDGKFIAVTASDWAKTDIYLLTGDGRNAALLTKSSSVKTGIPSWSPDGQALAVATLRDSTIGIDILTGIQPYKDRLMNPMKINVFQTIQQK